jgi:hypothetical protein
MVFLLGLAMPKYYVKSGNLKFIIDCLDQYTAIIKAIKRYRGRGLMLGSKICVSEQGFEDFRHWTCYDSDTYLNRND